MQFTALAASTREETCSKTCGGGVKYIPRNITVCNKQRCPEGNFTLFSSNVRLMYSLSETCPSPSIRRAYWDPENACCLPKPSSICGNPTISRSKRDISQNPRIIINQLLIGSGKLKVGAAPWQV